MIPLRKSSVSLSLPSARMVRGYEIRRMPLGAFLAAMEQLQGFPALLMEGLFPGQKVESIFAQLKACTGDMLVDLLARALTIAPGQVIRLAAGLTGIGENRLLEDGDIGLAGLTDILTAWLEVNEIENFTRAARHLWARAGALAGGSGGCSG
ncbi:MAG: hypothetical protein GXY67_04205 [Clostridiales bacterium]|nr:hypothetical protein [Clostridiales bacterium]